MKTTVAVKEIIEGDSPSVGVVSVQWKRLFRSSIVLYDVTMSHIVYSLCTLI